MVYVFYEISVLLFNIHKSPDEINKKAGDISKVQPCHFIGFKFQMALKYLVNIWQDLTRYLIRSLGRMQLTAKTNSIAWP